MVKLAFIDTVGDAYLFTLLRPLVLLRTGWLPLLITIISWFSQSPRWLVTPLGSAVHFVLSLLVFVSGITWSLAYTRSILLDETSWTSVLQFRRRHWRLVWLSFLVFLIWVIPFAVVFLSFSKVLPVLGAPGHPARLFAIALGFAEFISFSLFEAVVWARLGLALPAIAAEDPVRAIRAAWHRGKRNSARLFFGALICVLPFFAASEVLLWQMMTRAIPVNGNIPPDPLSYVSAMTAPRMAVFIVPLALIELIGGAVLIAFYAFAYRQLAPNWNPPPTLTAAQIET